MQQLILQLSAMVQKLEQMKVMNQDIFTIQPGRED